MAPKSKKAAKKGASFTIDCSKPVEDQIMDLAAFEQFLASKIKVLGKAGALGDVVSVKREGKTKVVIESPTEAVSKRYMKYLTKKFLKKHNVRDWLRVVASNTDRSTYQLRYFDIASEGGDDK